MENMMSGKGTSDSNEAIQALEAGARLIARMIVKAVVAELREQERYFGDAVSGYVAAASAVDKGVKQPGRTVYTVEEAGKMLGISRATAYECVQTGQIPSLRFGKRILVPRAALLKLLDDVSLLKPQPGSIH